jgi:hypothetical protein
MMNVLCMLLALISAFAGDDAAMAVGRHYADKADPSTCGLIMISVIIAILPFRCFYISASFRHLDDLCYWHLRQ